MGQPKLIEDIHFNTPEILRTEVNFLTLPFFALSRKELAHKDETVYQSRIERNGKAIEVLWKVSRSINYQYPGPFDRNVHKAIEEIINELPPPVTNPIGFSVYELCQRMGITTQGGQNYRKVKEALKTVVATTIESKGTFYSKGKKNWVNDIFHLYDRIIFKGEQLPNGEVADKNYLFLGSWYLDSINSRYVKPLDYKYYKSLKRTIAQRLYELLGVKFYRVLQSETTFLNYRYSTLCQLLPITTQKHFSLVRQQLQPAHKELIQTGFLEKVDWKDMEGEGDWVLHYYPGARAEEERQKFGMPLDEPALETEPEQLGLPLPATAEKDEFEVQSLVKEMLQVLGDEQSKSFYTKIARLAPSTVIYRCLSEVKDEWRREMVRTTKGAVFTDKVKRYCQQRGIELGIKVGN